MIALLCQNVAKGGQTVQKRTVLALSVLSSGAEDLKRERNSRRGAKKRTHGPARSRYTAKAPKTFSVRKGDVILGKLGKIGHIIDALLGAAFLFGGVGGFKAFQVDIDQIAGVSVVIGNGNAARIDVFFIVDQSLLAIVGKIFGNTQGIDAENERQNKADRNGHRTDLAKQQMYRFSASGKADKNHVQNQCAKPRQNAEHQYVNDRADPRSRQRRKKGEEKVIEFDVEGNFIPNGKREGGDRQKEKEAEQNDLTPALLLAGSLLCFRYRRVHIVLFI